jgi:hypothetical protein
VGNQNPVPPNKKAKTKTKTTKQLPGVLSENTKFLGPHPEQK